MKRNEKTNDRIRRIEVGVYRGEDDAEIEVAACLELETSVRVTWADLDYNCEDTTELRAYDDLVVVDFAGKTFVVVDSVAGENISPDNLDSRADMLAIHVAEEDLHALPTDCGWILADIDSTGLLEIRKGDECDRFVTDEDAVNHVKKHAAEGDEVCLDAWNKHVAAALDVAKYRAAARQPGKRRP